jgi:hypothetical protein
VAATSPPEHVRHVLGAVRHPADRAWRHAEFVLQHAPDPERDWIEMRMDTDTATAQIFGADDIGVQADHDAAMIESAMRENRDRGNPHPAALQAQVLCDLQLTDIEFEISDEACVTLGRRQRNHRKIQAWCRDRAVNERACTVVVTAGQG